MSQGGAHRTGVPTVTVSCPDGSFTLSLGGEQSGTDKMSQSLGQSLLFPLGSPSLRFHARIQNLMGPGDTGQLVHS